MIKLKDLLKEQKDSDSAAGICLYFGNLLLCCKRTDSYWSIPKGHLLEGEDPEVGAKREFYEETQIDLKEDLELVKEFNNGRGDFYLFKCNSDTKYIPQLDFEHEEWAYCNKSNLPKEFDTDIFIYIK